MCPELLYQQSYFDDLSRIIAIFLLIAPSKKQFQKIISCLIISPLSSDILMMLIDKNWIPLEDLIDGLAAIMMDSRPVQHEIELSRSPSLVKGNENLPDIADLSGTFWDQLISLNSLENKSKAVLRSTATTMINSLLQKCNQSQLLIFRSKLSFYKLLPSLCLKITREKLFDMWVYLDSMLDTTIQSLTGYSEGAVPLAIARLDEHWFFSSLTPTIVSELLSSLFLDLRGCLQRAGGEVDETRNLYTLVRLICALFSSTSNIHKVPCPSSADVVGISADFDWIKDHVIQTLHCLQSLPPPVQATFPFLFRLSTSLVFVYIISSRRQNPSTQVTDHMDLLSKYDQLRETFHCPDRDHKVYCQYLTLCFSLDKIGFLRDACSREISLERFIDFLPQTSFLYLSNIIRNFSQNRGESALFGSTKEKLLTEVSSSLLFVDLTTAL